MIFLGHLESVLLHEDQTVQLRDKLTAVETECEVEFDGSKVYRDIMILVFPS